MIQHMQAASSLMNKIIHCNIRLNCDAKRAFEMFTVNELLTTWLSVEAEVEPRAGGKYELFWDPTDREHDSTIGCRMTVCVPHKLLAFEWKGARQFKHFMNAADPLTHVTVAFIPTVERGHEFTDVHLVHSGWRSGTEWGEAYSWFERAWQMAFTELSAQINK